MWQPYRPRPPPKVIFMVGSAEDVEHTEDAEMRRAKKFLVTLVSGEDGFIVAECPALPGCISQGRTRPEALNNIREAIEASLLTRHELGLEPSIQVVEVKVAVPA